MKLLEVAVTVACPSRLVQEWDFWRPPKSLREGSGVSDLKMYLLFFFFSSTFFFRRQMVLTKANSTKLPKMNPVQPRNQISDALM